VVRVIILYPEAPDAESYARHIDFCRGQVPDAVIRHGRIFGSPAGKPDFSYYSEFEFANREAFGAAGPGLERTAEDAQDLGVGFQVYFAEID
jgi:hypothetical protein